MQRKMKTDVIGDSKGRNTFSIIYEDSAIAKNVDELSKLMSDEDIEQLKHLTLLLLKSLQHMIRRLKKMEHFLMTEWG